MKKKKLKKLFDSCPFCGGITSLNESDFFNDCDSPNNKCIFLVDMDKDGNFVKAEFNDREFSSVDEVWRFVKLRSFE